MSELAAMGRRRSVTDVRDNNYLLARKPTKKTAQYWKVPDALDQGDTPQCVDYSGYQWLRAFPIKNVPVFTPEALYKEAQKNDEFRGENYEGSSVRGLIKALKKMGYVSEYRWARSTETIVEHLLTTGPVVVGTMWTEGMFMADSEGYIDDIGGKDTGGHAYVLIGASRVKKSKRHGVGAVRILNSWGTGREDNGRAWLSINALRWLMREDGEACAANELKL